MNSYGHFLAARPLVRDQRNGAPYSPYRFERQEEDREPARTGVATAVAVLAYVAIVLVVLAAITVGGSEGSTPDARHATTCPPGSHQIWSGCLPGHQLQRR
jgi:hypothetical protein